MTNPTRPTFPIPNYVPPSLKIHPGMAFVACCSGKLSDLEKQVEAGINVNLAVGGETLLYIACKNGHLEIAQFLIDSGANVNRLSQDVDTPLHMVCGGYLKSEEKERKIAQLLIESGADVNYPSQYNGRTPLSLACEHDNWHLVTLLIESGADVDSIDAYGKTPLHYACSYKRNHHIHTLITHGANPNIATGDGETPLALVTKSRWGLWDPVHRLLAGGASVQAPIPVPSQALAILERMSQHIEGGLISELLLATEYNIQQFVAASDTLVNRLTPLVEEALRRQWEHLQRGLTCAGDCVYAESFVAMEKAAAVSQIPAAKIAGDENLISTIATYSQFPSELRHQIVGYVARNALLGAMLPEEPGQNQTWWSAAARGREVLPWIGHFPEKIQTKATNYVMDMPERLASTSWAASGRAIAAYNRMFSYRPVESLMNLRALSEACQTGDLRIVQDQIAAGADINRVLDDRGRRAIHLLCENNHLEIVQLLVAQGADIDCPGEFDKTPLYLACDKGNLAIVQFLTTKGANIHRTAYRFDSPLNIACASGHLEVVKHLISEGADINGGSYDKPLSCAVFRHRWDIVKLLILEGANTQAPSTVSILRSMSQYDETGRDLSALILATEYNIQACVESESDSYLQHRLKYLVKPALEKQSQHLQNGLTCVVESWLADVYATMALAADSEVWYAGLPQELRLKVLGDKVQTMCLDAMFLVEDPAIPAGASPRRALNSSNVSESRQIVVGADAFDDADSNFTTESSATFSDSASWNPARIATKDPSKNRTWWSAAAKGQKDLLFLIKYFPEEIQMMAKNHVVNVCQNFALEPSDAILAKADQLAHRLSRDLTGA